MKYAWSLRLSFLCFLVLCLVVVLSSCSKKDVRMEEPLVAAGDSGAGALVPEASPVDSAPVGTTEPAPELRIVYFDYDRYTIRSDGRDALKSNSGWLKRNPTVSVQIEGHCDERGTPEYNLALGERRASAVRDYLARLGIPVSRLSTVSYGEERASDPGHDESAWTRNRRAVFIVVSR